MGYSADIINQEGVPFVVPKARYADMLAAFAEAERNLGYDTRMGRISWCEAVASYKYPANLLYDYGFMIDDVSSEDEFTIDDWGGDKLGSSHDDVMNVLAQFAPGEITWIWLGEHGERWATRFDGAGNWAQLEVKMTVVEN